MKLVYPTVLCVLAYMIGALSHVRAQFSVEQLQNLATNALNILLDSASSGSSASSRQCIPYKLPNEFTSYQDFCKYLSMKSDDEIDEMFMNGDGPDTGYQEFPLKGCVLGCIIGEESYRRGMSWGSGSWSGKCIRNSHDIINLLTPLPSIGGVMTVQDAFNWSNFLPTLERYPGSIDVDWSWWDAYNTLASSGRMSKVWTLTYEDVEIPETGEDGALDDIMSAYPRLVKGSRDEVRLIEPGLMFGQLFRKPNSFLNPTPFPVDSGIRFAMIQEMNSVSIVRPGVPCRHGAAYFPKSLPRLGLYGSGKLIKKTIRNHRVWVPNAAASDEPEIPKETSVDDQGGFEEQVAVGSSESHQYSPEFVRTRLITFAGIVLGYACFYLTRNSLTYTAPVMVADKALGISLTDIGTLTSIFPIMYGMSKFLSGVLGSRTSPKILLAGGLMATAIMNIAFGFSASMVWFSVFWSINGMLQGLGAPGCARILTSWFAAKERGTYWGMWNIAHNMGGFLAPLLAGTAAKMYGWQWGLFAPGLVGIAMGFLILVGVKDSPESAGFPSVEGASSKAQSTKDEESSKSGSQKESLLDLLVNDCLKNPFVVGLAITYFFIYVVRQGVTSWFVFYLLQVKEVADAGAASLRVSGLELGGLFGSLLAGKISDILISKSKKGEGTVGKRIQVVIGYTVGIAAMLAAFAATPTSLGWLQWLTVFMIGFFLYGPQMMIGLCGAELVRPDSVGASQGFLGWVAYLGAANAGIPLSLVVRDLGWGAYFSTLMAACGVAVLLLLPMINAKSYIQVKEES